MPDDNFRPTHGFPPDSRTNVPPEWWSLLARDDLPEGGAERETAPVGAWGRGRVRPRGHGLRSLLGARARVAVADLVVFAMVIAIIVVGLGYATPSGVVLLVFGAVSLLVVVGIQVARLTGRRRW